MTSRRIAEVVTEGPGRMSVRQVEADAEPTETQVRVRVERVGVCGSDSKLFDGTHPYLPYPIVQGHEICGTIDAVGAGVLNLSVGTRVVVEPLVSCGVCIACRRGHRNCCVDVAVLGVHLPGGLRETITLEAQLVHPANDLPPDVAVFAEPVAVALHALNRSGVLRGETLLVTAAGSIGRAVTLAAASRGVRVIVADREMDPRRLEWTRALGAEATVGPDTDLLSSVDAFTAGEGCVAVIDVTGLASVVESALKLAAPGGAIVVVGLTADQVWVPVHLLSRKELMLSGSRNSVGCFPEAIELLAAHAEAVASTVTDVFALDEAPKALHMIAARTIGWGKVLIDPSRHSEYGMP